MTRENDVWNIDEIIVQAQGHIYAETGGIPPAQHDTLRARTENVDNVPAAPLTSNGRADIERQVAILLADVSMEEEATPEPPDQITEYVRQIRETLIPVLLSHREDVQRHEENSPSLGEGPTCKLNPPSSEYDELDRESRQPYRYYRTLRVNYGELSQRLAVNLIIERKKLDPFLGEASGIREAVLHSHVIFHMDNNYHGSGTDFRGPVAVPFEIRPDRRDHIPQATFALGKIATAAAVVAGRSQG